MSSFKFGQQNILTKDFYKVIPIDYFTLDVDNIVVSDPITFFGKTDTRYVIGYKIDGKIVALHIKTPKDIYPFGVSQYSVGSPWNMGFDLEGYESWLEKYIKIWDVVEDQLFQSFTKDPVNKARYINPKLKEYDGKILTNFHDRDVPYGKCCEATGVLRIASVYKQGNNCYPQCILDECKYKEVKHHGVLLLSDDDEEYDTVF